MLLHKRDKLIHFFLLSKPSYNLVKPISSIEYHACIYKSSLFIYKTEHGLYSPILLL